MVAWQATEKSIYGKQSFASLLSFCCSSECNLDELFDFLFSQWSCSLMRAEKWCEIRFFQSLSHDVGVSRFFRFWIDDREKWFSIVLEVWSIPFPEIKSPVNTIFLRYISDSSPLLWVWWIELISSESYIDSESVLMIRSSDLREFRCNQLFLSLFTSPCLSDEDDFWFFVDFCNPFLDFFFEFWSEFVCASVCCSFHIFDWLLKYYLSRDGLYAASYHIGNAQRFCHASSWSRASRFMSFTSFWELEFLKESWELQTAAEEVIAFASHSRWSISCLSISFEKVMNKRRTLSLWVGSLHMRDSRWKIW